MNTKKIAVLILALGSALSLSAQFKTDTLDLKEQVAAEHIITLDDAIQIALSESNTVKLADMEVKRVGYAKQGSYASLFPTISAMGSYSRTIKKQVMYMDFSMPGMGAGAGAGEGAGSGSGSKDAAGIEIGRDNTYSAGISGQMPLVNAQVWKSIKISAIDVEVAVEKARASKIQTVTQTKNAYYAVLLAKQAFEVYKVVYENALENYRQTEMKALAGKATDLALAQSKTSVLNAIPNVYNAETSVELALWRLKAVMGVDLSESYDVVGSLDDYVAEMLFDEADYSADNLENNSNLRQLALQCEQLAQTVKLQALANLPTISGTFSYSTNAMTNNFEFSSYRWTPYATAGLTLSIPIFTGGRNTSNYRQAKNRSAQLELQKQDVERQLRISVANSLMTMETAVKSYEASSSAVDTAQKAFDIAQTSYKYGRSTLLELDNAQLSLTQSKLQQCQTIYNFLSAKTTLEETLGNQFLEENE